MFTLSLKATSIRNTIIRRSFASEDGYTVFAEGSFASVDFLSAAIQARDAIEPLLDAMRLEFEPGLLSVDQSGVRDSPGRSERKMLVHVDNPVPNPVDQAFDEVSFKSFSERLASVLTSSAVDTESKNRVETALRRYRFGRDSHNYSDKFLHWWMGLEALTSVGGVRIGRTVADNVKYGMLSGYLFRILRDMVITLKYIKVEWHADLRAEVSVDKDRRSRRAGIAHKSCVTKGTGDATLGLGSRMPLCRSKGSSINYGMGDGSCKDFQEVRNYEFSPRTAQLARRSPLPDSMLSGAWLCLKVHFRLALYSANLEVLSETDVAVHPQ